MIRKVGHNYSFEAQENEEIESRCKAAVVSSSNWTACAFLWGIEASQEHFSRPSLVRRAVPSPHHCSHGQLSLSPKTMGAQILQAPHQSKCNLLWSMWSSLDRCAGWQISTWATPGKSEESGGGVDIYTETRRTMEFPKLEPRRPSQSPRHCSQTPKEGKKIQKRQEQEQEAGTGTASSPST